MSESFKCPKCGESQWDEIFENLDLRSGSDAYCEHTTCWSCDTPLIIRVDFNIDMEEPRPDELARYAAKEGHIWNRTASRVLPPEDQEPAR